MYRSGAGNCLVGRGGAAKAGEDGLPDPAETSDGPAGGGRRGWLVDGDVVGWAGVVGEHRDAAGVGGAEHEPAAVEVDHDHEGFAGEAQGVGHVRV